MKKIIIAPDSFKETMTNVEVSEIIYNSLRNKYPQFSYKIFPVADGGEGSLNSFSKTGGIIKKCLSEDANGNIAEVNYLLYSDSIVIEVAQNVGFKYKKEISDPGNTTTYGIGTTIKEALKSGLKKVYICLGGTITNDGGCGLASSLGVKFFNDKNEEFIPTGITLKNIKHIDNSYFLKEYKDIEFIGLCDVNNPLYGENGASYIFAPQKGATKEQVIELDEGLKCLEQKVMNSLNVDYANVPGAGAAGGLGYCIISMLNGKLQKGINTILDITNFDKEITDECIVITGEGKLDNQSLNGKVISGIMERIKNKKTHLIVICGKFDGDKEYFHKQGIDQIYITNEENFEFEIVKKICKQQLEKTIQKIDLFN